MQNVLTIYKLIILYMLDKVNSTLTNSQLSEYIVDREYTNYFTIQQVLSEAVDSNLIKKETTYHATIYQLTNEGKETIDYFYQEISPAIREDIDAYLKKNDYNLRNDTDIISDYYRNTNQEYSVHLQIKEKKAQLMDLTITVPSESLAQSIANNWTKNSQEVYALIMKQLL